LDMVPDEEKVYLSYDSPIHRNLNDDHIDNVHTPEFLNTITAKSPKQVHFRLGWDERIFLKNIK